MSEETPPPDVAEVRKKILEGRRALVTGTTLPPKTDEAREAQKESRRRRDKPPLVRLPILIAFVVLLVMALGGGVYAFFHYREDNSDAGVVRRRLVAWEFTLDPGKRDGEVVPIDQMGARGVREVIALLSDTRTAAVGSSHSNTTVQRLAHAYLVRYAAMNKVEAPPIAAELTRAFNEGVLVAPAKWEEAQRAWQKWLADAQAKGTIK